MTLTMKALPNAEIDKLIEEPQLAIDLLLPEGDDEDPSLGYLDKAWHGIHYLLTGTAWEGDPPLNALITGNEELADPDQEWGYGPPHILRPADVAAFNDALDAVSNRELVERFNPQDMPRRRSTR